METIVSRGAPSAQTPGVVGDLYVDMDTDKVYRCTNVVTTGSELGFVKVTAYHITNRTYEWQALELASGGDTPDTPKPPEEPEQPAVNWLFENATITDIMRYDLPKLTPGGSYTAFVDGVEVATVTAGEYGVDFTGEPIAELHGSIVLVHEEFEGEFVWLFHPVDSAITSGVVSIRINSEPEMPVEPETPAEQWLFKDEYITDEQRYDLPLPVEGKSYTAFVDGVEIGTDTASMCNVFFDNGSMQLTGDYDIGWWGFNLSCEVSSGTVSIRIND